MVVSQAPDVCREELGSLSPGRLVQIWTRTTLSPCSVKQYPFVVSPAPMLCRSAAPAVYGVPQGLHQGSGQTFLKLLWFTWAFSAGEKFLVWP